MCPEPAPSDAPSPGSPADFVVEAEYDGCRVDWYLAQRLPAYSRVHLRKLINAAGVKIDGRRTKAAHRLRTGERVTVDLPELVREAPQAEDIPLDVLYEDEHIAVINKPSGMVVHPAKGHWSGTLTAALQFHFDHLSAVGGATRPGIVHRLDRDTSGVMVVAKTDRVHMQLADQFEQRVVEKEYAAVVAGVPDHDRDVIEMPIGAHPYHREKMAIRRDHTTSRRAETFYEVAQRFRGFALVKAMPKTGRTHQIRLHLASIGCPVLCDRLYGGRAQITQGEISGQSPAGDVLLDRQALHARRLKFVHPASGAEVEFIAPIPADIERVLAALRQFRA